jgi:hypothetical protein
MGYMKIQNLYKPTAQDILLFKECYAMEKIHGTSAHIKFSPAQGLCFFSGGVSHEQFVALFNKDELKRLYTKADLPIDVEVVIYGEAYGGSCQKMSNVYGKDLKFIVFDVTIGDNWLTVPNAEDVATKLELEFVYYQKIPTDLELIDKARDKPSVQAQRNGMGEQWSEGVVLRPLIEVIKSNGKRVICKHKREEYRETKTKREVTSEQLKVLEDANAIADEWVTEMRLQHVLDKLDGPHDMTIMRQLIPAMLEDIKREAEGEIVWNKAVSSAITKRTAEIMKNLLNSRLGG